MPNSSLNDDPNSENVFSDELKKIHLKRILKQILFSAILILFIISIVVKSPTNEELIIHNLKKISAHLSVQNAKDKKSFQANQLIKYFQDQLNIRFNVKYREPKIITSKMDLLKKASQFINHFDFLDMDFKNIKVQLMDNNKKAQVKTVVKITFNDDTSHSEEIPLEIHFKHQKRPMVDSRTQIPKHS